MRPPSLECKLCLRTAYECSGTELTLPRPLLVELTCCSLRSEVKVLDSLPRSPKRPASIRIMVVVAMELPLGLVIFCKRHRDPESSQGYIVSGNRSTDGRLRHSPHHALHGTKRVHQKPRMHTSSTADCMPRTEASIHHASIAIHSKVPFLLSSFSME